jgi:hypothetical protein
LIIVLPLLLLVVMCLVIWSSDEAPPDVSDLVFKPLDLPEEKNAYAVVSQVTSLPALREWTDDEDKKLEALYANEDWDEALAQTALADLTPAWPLLEKAAALPAAQAPWLTSFDDLLPEIGPIRKRAQLLQLKALSEARAGHPDEALRTALVAVSIGRLMEESRGSLIHYLIGAMTKQTGLKTIQLIVTHYTPSPEALRRTLDAVSASRSPSEALKLSLYSELRTFDSMLVHIRTNGLGVLSSGTPSPWLKPTGRIPLLLKPNRTRRIFSEYLRNSAALIDHPFDALVKNSLLRDFIPAQTRARFRYSPDNYLGRMFLNIVTPTTAGILKTRLRHQSQISATEALLAAHLYKHAHGEFPATLDDLVPALLPSVPRDYADGAPIRYSRDLGVIWSAGENSLVITDPAQPLEARDTVVHLPPRQPAAKDPAPATADTP